jgi:hypothetical protein
MGLVLDRFQFPPPSSPESIPSADRSGRTKAIAVLCAGTSTPGVDLGRSLAGDRRCTAKRTVKKPGANRGDVKP